MSLYVEQREPMQKIVSEIYEKRDNVWFGMEPSKRDLLLQEALELSISRLEEITAAPKKKKRKSKPSVLQSNGAGTANGSSNNVKRTTVTSATTTNTNATTTNILTTSPPINPMDENFPFGDVSNLVSREGSKKALNLLYEPAYTIHMTREQKAFFFYCYGHLHNVFSSYNPVAEQFLSKSIKLDPTLMDAWNSLGESFWKRGDLESAMHCFLDALEHSRDTKTLINLSMIYRQANDNLGTSFLYCFFTENNREYSNLQKSLGAYNKSALLMKNEYDNPDLYYNRGTVHLYMESYQEALDDLLLCKKVDPFHEQVSSQIELVLDQMRKITNFIHGPRPKLPNGVKISSSTVSSASELMDQAKRFQGRFVQELIDTKNRYCRIFILYHEASKTLVPVTVYQMVAYQQQVDQQQMETFLSSSSVSASSSTSDAMFKDFSLITIEEADIRYNKFKNKDEPEFAYWSVRVVDPRKILLQNATVRLPDSFIATSEILIQARPE